MAFKIVFFTKLQFLLFFSQIKAALVSMRYSFENINITCLLMVSYASKGMKRKTDFLWL